jgi:DNA-binding response OmpR family regulator
MVDDEPDVTHTFKAALEGSGYFQVDVFNDAA